MRKVIVFFNGGAPYVVEVGEHLNSVVLEYPNGERATLQIMEAMNVGAQAFAADRDVSFHEVQQAVAELI